MSNYVTVASDHARRAAHERLRQLYLQSGRDTADTEGDLQSRDLVLPGAPNAANLVDCLKRAESGITDCLVWPTDRTATPSARDQEDAEGDACYHLYDAIAQTELPIAALDDPGFWTWISMRFLWNFILYREAKAVKRYHTALDQHEDTSQLEFLKYIDGKKAQCVSRRMYLRVRCLGDSGRHLAREISEGTDFWRSAILRRKQGDHPPIVRAIATRQARPKHDDRGGRLSTNALRAFSRNLSFEARNLDLHSLSDRQLEALVGRLWMEQQNQPGQ